MRLTLTLINVWQHIKSLAENMERQQRYAKAKLRQRVLWPTRITIFKLLFEFSILSDLFSQYTISLRWRNTHNVIILIAQTVTAFQHNRWRKNILSSVFDTVSDMRSARALLCKLATYTRQIFLSKLKLLQTRQTSRKNKKQSKAELGYD